MALGETIVSHFLLYKLCYWACVGPQHHPAWHQQHSQKTSRLTKSYLFLSSVSLPLFTGTKPSFPAIFLLTSEQFDKL